MHGAGKNAVQGQAPISPLAMQPPIDVASSARFKRIFRSPGFPWKHFLFVGIQDFLGHVLRSRSGEPGRERGHDDPVVRILNPGNGGIVTLRSRIPQGAVVGLSDGVAIGTWCHAEHLIRVFVARSAFSCRTCRPSAPLGSVQDLPGSAPRKSHACGGCDDVHGARKWEMECRDDQASATKSFLPSKLIRNLTSAKLPLRRARKWTHTKTCPSPHHVVRCMRERRMHAPSTCSTWFLRAAGMRLAVVSAVHSSSRMRFKQSRW